MPDDEQVTQTAVHGSGRAQQDGPPGLPGWVKVFALLAAVVLGVVAFAVLGGHDTAGHGPGRHLGAGTAAPPAVALLLG